MDRLLLQPRVQDHLPCMVEVDRMEVEGLR